MSNLNLWFGELEQVDDLENHKKTLADLEEAFLHSSIADNREDRIKALWLLNHFKALLN